MSSARHTSSNLLLMALVAMSAYVKFETVAKSTIIFSVYLFVVDPLPGLTRIVAIVSTVVVLILNRWYQTAMTQQQAEESIDVTTSVDGGTTDGDGGSGTNDALGTKND